MEKISGIVAGSNRVTSVDLKNASPVRPGTPAFGRPVSASTPSSRPTVTTSERAEAAREALQESRARDPKADIVSGLADRFFMKNKTIAEQEPNSEIKINLPAVSEAQSPRVEELMESSLPAEELTSKYTPRGSFIDLTA